MFYLSVFYDRPVTEFHPIFEKLPLCYLNRTPSLIAMKHTLGNLKTPLY